MIGGIKKALGGIANKLTGGLFDKLKGIGQQLLGKIGEALGGIMGGKNPLDFLKMLDPTGLTQGLGLASKMRGL